MVRDTPPEVTLRHMLGYLISSQRDFLGTKGFQYEFDDTIYNHVQQYTTGGYSWTQVWISY
jgi:hypothetical protein